MAGTKEGSKKAQETIRRKYGDDFFRKNGKKGSDAYLSKPKEERKPRGFAVHRDLARKMGKTTKRGKSERNDVSV